MVTNSNLWDCFTPAQAYAMRQLDDRMYRATMDCIMIEINDNGLTIEQAIDLVIGDCNE